MRQFGLKIHSGTFLKNPDFIRCVCALAEQKQIDFIEIYAFPDTFNETGSGLRRIFNGLPVFIHAPHSDEGFDPSNTALKKQNAALFKEACRFADIFDASEIVVHPGIGHSLPALEEAMRQIKALNQNDGRIVIENMPPFADCDGKFLMNGCYPLDLVYLTAETRAGFLLDMANAACVAAYIKLAPVPFITQLMKVKPVRLHLSDGRLGLTQDLHLHLGQGDYPLKEMLAVTDELPITLETGRGLPTDIAPFQADLTFLKHILE